MIPVLGVFVVCYLTAGLCLASSGVVWWTSREKGLGLGIRDLGVCIREEMLR